MATTKTVNVTTGKILNYQVTKNGYKPVTGSVYVDGNKTININMVSSTSSDSVYTFGDRILNMATFVGYYTPGGSYDTMPISTTTISQTVGSGLNNLGIKKGIFEAQVNPTYSKTTGTTNYEFIYNGTDWTYNSNNVDLNDYGIFYNTSNSSASNGDKIQVIYTVYSKYAVFVLDSNYRATASFGTYGTDIPNYPNYYDMSDGSGSDSSTWYYLQNVGKESATWCNEQLLDNRGFSWNNLPAMSYCRSLGKYIMANGIEVYPLLPNPTELYTIYSNRVSIDNYDPIIQSGTTTNNLTNWTIGGTDYIMACVEYSNNRIWNLKSNGEWEYYYSSKDTNYGIIPIFEVPCI